VLSVIVIVRHKAERRPKQQQQQHVQLTAGLEATLSRLVTVRDTAAMPKYACKLLLLSKLNHTK